MDSLTTNNMIVLFFSLGCLLGMAHILGALAQRFHQPAVVGELLAGVLLGPTVFGYLAPEYNLFLFPLHGPNAIVLEAISVLAVVLFLMVAGIEVDLSTVWKHGKTGLKIGITSVVIPLFSGFFAAWMFPGILGQHAGADPVIFALFFAVALSISALPVIAKTLMDMDLYRSDLGMVVISAAIFNDIVGWIVFAMLLSLIGSGAGHSAGIIPMILLTLGFVGMMLTLGRWLIHHALAFLNRYTKWPSGVLGFALTLALLCGAFTEWIGIHAIFGAFFAGVAIGDSPHLREHTKSILNNFISFFFAPLFFASIGLRVNFFTHLDFTLIITVLLIACLCKIAGSMLGARWAAMSIRESWAVGFGLNSRGAMEIILALLALDAGLICPPLFVALVIMAIITSMISGPMIRFCLRPGRKKRGLPDYLSRDCFMRPLAARSRREAIREMTMPASKAMGVDAEDVFAAVWEREEALSTGIGNRVALPHARINGLAKPLVVVGISETGIDFDAPDGKPANILFLVLTPAEDSGAQLEIASEIARLFRNYRLSDLALQARSYTEFLNLINTEIESIPA